MPIKEDLVNLQKFCPRIILDMRYATKNNFTKAAIYPSSVCYLLKNVAVKLNEVQRDLEKVGLGLKVFDGYRPVFCQKIFWELMPDPRYVADPKIGSNHNRGIAVDVTLVSKNGKELLMPSAFDDFSEKAHRDFMDLPEEAIQNRKILEDAMVKRDFLPFPTEWWHFDFKGWKNYEMLDYSFDQLQDL